MSQASAMTPNRANFVTADHCSQRRRALRLNASVMQKSRDLFQIKTAHHLAEITGYSLRSCEYWLSEKVVIPSDALAALIQSEWGREYLSTVMADQTPRWWKQLTAWIAAVDYTIAERKLRRKRKEMLDAIAYEPATSAAQMLWDEEFNSAQVAPARRPHRSMDSKGSR